MQSDKVSLILPILLITLGIGWLLTTLGVGPGIDWVWTLALAVIGVLTIALGGLDKVTVVLGPLFHRRQLFVAAAADGTPHDRHRNSHPGDRRRAAPRGATACNSAAGLDSCGWRKTITARGRVNQCCSSDTRAPDSPSRTDFIKHQVNTATAPPQSIRRSMA